MYLPAHFEETRPEVLSALIKQHPLGTLVTLGTGGLTANHLPFELNGCVGPGGLLQAHVARANPVWHDFSNTVETLVIFQGPSAYITPSWYPTKSETGKVVPTYNYCVVHAYGVLRAIDDPAWLRAFVGRLTDRYEATRPAPWKPTDAPADFLEKQIAAIVGIEVAITRLTGKWKLSQNRPAVDRQRVGQGLRDSDDAEMKEMAQHMPR